MRTADSGRRLQHAQPVKPFFRCDGAGEPGGGVPRVGEGERHVALAADPGQARAGACEFGRDDSMHFDRYSIARQRIWWRLQRGPDRRAVVPHGQQKCVVAEPVRAQQGQLDGVGHRVAAIQRLRDRAELPCRLVYPDLHAVQHGHRPRMASSDLHRERAQLHRNMRRVACRHAPPCTRGGAPSSRGEAPAPRLAVRGQARFDRRG